jgi:hypothetical protein
MSTHLLVQRIAALVPEYEKSFSERGGLTPSDPLKFHLYHLSLYWSRLVGFCRQAPAKSAGFVHTDLGACIAIGSEYAHNLIGLTSPIYEPWQEYWRRTQLVLYGQLVTLKDVESASRAFDDCLAGLNFDPWPKQNPE